MKYVLIKILGTKALLTLLLLSSAQSSASPTANYFRVWQGFKKAELTNQQLLNELPQFMKDTIDLYEKEKVLNSYIVVMPPKNKPSYIPDELALVGLSSEEEYRKIRQTPEGQSYSERHWDIFDKETSASAKTFIDYTSAQPKELIHNAAYDMFGMQIDWSSGYNLVYIGLRKPNFSPQEYLSNLKNHIELVKKTLGPKGLRGYIVISNENYEVAYINWASKDAFEKSNSSESSKIVFKDAERFMDTLMYSEVRAHRAGDAIENNSSYSSLVNSAPASKTLYICSVSNDEPVNNDTRIELIRTEKSFSLNIEGYDLPNGSFDVERRNHQEISFHDTFFNSDENITLEVFLDDMGGMSSLFIRGQKLELTCETI